MHNKELSHESKIKINSNSFDLMKNSTGTGKFVVDLPGIGTVDRNGLQHMIKVHNLCKTVKEVEDERLWVTKAESQLSSNMGLKELLQPVKEYANTLWSSGEKDKAFGINIKDTMQLVSILRFSFGRRRRSFSQTIMTWSSHQLDAQKVFEVEQKVR